MSAIAVAKDIFVARHIGADQLPAVSVTPLPIDEAAEAKRARLHRTGAWLGGPAFRLGDSLLLLEAAHAATVAPVRQALGWRYITLQIADIDTIWRCT